MPSLRFLFLLSAFVLPWAIEPAAAFAQDAAPAATDSDAPAATWPEWIGINYPDQFLPSNFARGQGYYFSIVKIALSVILLLLWVKSCDWVNQDAQYHKHAYMKWSTIVFLPFVVAFLLQFLIPWYYFVSLPLLLVAYLGPLFAYVGFRNKKAHDDDQVFTADHVRDVFASLLGKKVGERKAKGPVSPITLSARNAPNPEEKQKREIGARQSPGHHMARDVLHKSFMNRSTGIMLDYSQEAVAVKYLVDGVWLDGETMPRQIGDPLLATLKVLCGLKPEDRRGRQTGTFTAVDGPANRTAQCKFTSQGTKTGERALIQFEDAQVRKRRLPDIGLRQKTQEDLQNLVNQKAGFVIIGAPPGNGLTSLTTAVLSAVDRFTRSVMGVEDKNSKDLEVENVPVTLYDSLEQETPMSKLPGVVRQFPDVIVVPELVNAETATLLCEEATGDDRLIFTTVRAKEAAEALLLPAATTKVPMKKYAGAVSGAIVQRLVRKLCDKCKEAYPPQAPILQKLGIPADKVQAFYRPPTQPRQEVCPDCHGLGYHGQIPLFELLIVDDLMRQTLQREPKLETIRAAARKSGMKTMEEEGLLLVVKGQTSVAELARVLKEGQPAAAPVAPAKPAVKK